MQAWIITPGEEEQNVNMVAMSDWVDITTVDDI